MNTNAVRTLETKLFSSALELLIDTVCHDMHESERGAFSAYADSVLDSRDPVRIAALFAELVSRLEAQGRYLDLAIVSVEAGKLEVHALESVA